MDTNKLEMHQDGEVSVQIGEISGGNVFFNLIQTNSESNIVPYMNKEYSAAIIGLCKTINVQLIKLGTVLLKNPLIYSNDYLVSNDFNGWLSKLKDFINSFHIVEVSERVDLLVNSQLTTLAEYILALSPDTSVNLNTFYHERIVYINDCIYKYNEKANDFFIALGVLGLAKDYSNEKIYECVINDLRVFFMMVCDILDAYVNEIDYSIAENKAADEMNENIYNNIRFYFNNESNPALKILLERRIMLDVDLAQELNIDVVSLRRILFPATKSFLSFWYHSSASTEIHIPEPYITAIRKYYDELFSTEEGHDDSIEIDLERLFVSGESI